jgi:hypothetical protein
VAVAIAGQVPVRPIFLRELRVLTTSQRRSEKSSQRKPAKFESDHH